MESIKALKRFINKVIVPKRARRYSDLIERPKGQDKFLHYLYHEFFDYIKEDIQLKQLTKDQLSLPGMSFSQKRGFGNIEKSILSAYNELMPETGWLIIDSEGKYGIYQPEDIIDDQRQFGI